MAKKDKIDRLNVGESVRFPASEILSIRVLVSNVKKGTTKKFKTQVVGPYTLVTRLRDDDPGGRFRRLRAMQVGETQDFPGADYNKLHGSISQIEGEYEVTRITRVKRVR